jgi:hypothetical protein
MYRKLMKTIHKGYRGKKSRRGGLGYAGNHCSSNDFCSCRPLIPVVGRVGKRVIHMVQKNTHDFDMYLTDGNDKKSTPSLP